MNLKRLKLGQKSRRLSKSTKSKSRFGVAPGKRRVIASTVKRPEKQSKAVQTPNRSALGNSQLERSDQGTSLSSSFQQLLIPANHRIEEKEKFIVYVKWCE